MKIIANSEQLLLNAEVVHLLKEKARLRQGGQKAPAGLEAKVQNYLINLSGSPSPEDLKAFLASSERFDLTKPELLQVLNLRPRYPVELEIIGTHSSGDEKLLERLSTDEQQEDFLRLVEDKLRKLLTWAVMTNGGDYYDATDILSEETLIPVIFGTGVRGLGKLFDTSNAENDVPKGSRVEVPLWLGVTLSQRNIVELRMPRFYSNKMQRKMEVGAGCEDLRARCPQFYEVAYKLYEATGDAGLGNFVNNTFRARYKEILTNAHNTSAQGVTVLQSKLSQEELHLFEAGRLSIDRFDRWRRTGESGAKAPAHKRKMSSALQELDSNVDQSSRQRQAK